MGESGVAYTVNDALHSAINPANLGFISNNSNFGFSAYPQKTQYNKGSQNIYYSNWGLYAGHGFGEIFEGGRLSAGVGFYRQNYNVSKQINKNETRITNENTSAIRIAAMLDWMVDIGLGLGLKFLNSELARYEGDAVIAYDLGILVKVPVYENEKISDRFNFDLDINAGYSLLNIGDDMKYPVSSVYPTSTYLPYPLPRMASLGYALRSGLNMVLGDEKIKAVDILWTAEARDVLVTFENPYEGYKYDDRHFGGIRPVSDIFLLERSDVYSMYGFRINLFETIGISGGANFHEYWGSQRDVNTKGFFLSTAGISKMLAEWTESPVINFIADHAELNYMYAEYLPEGDQKYHNNRYYNQLWLVVKNFDLF